MKPITGTVLSSKAVSLKKCASVLSRFVASDTGAQQDVLGFLKRTSEAATELVQFYRDISSSKEDTGAEIFEEINRERIEEEEERKLSKKEKKKSKKERKDEDAAESIRVYENGDAVDVVDLKMEKKSRRKERRVGDEMEGLGGKSAEGVVDESIVEERKSKRKDKKKKKKRKNEGEASELTEDVDEASAEHPRVKKRKV